MIRKPSVAGAFYSDNPITLKNEIKKYISNAENKHIDDIKALISPHAGYLYSGHVAAEGYKQITDKNFDTVVIFAPCHRSSFDGVSIYNGKGYETPLGVVEIDTLLATHLISKSDLINFYPEAHSQEHSLEVQIPFLQTTLKNFKLLPVLTGTQDILQLSEICKIFNDTLKNKNVLFIASTDLSHFHDSKTAAQLDSVAINDIKNLNFKQFYNNILNRKTEACGAAPVLIILYLASLNNWNKCDILKYADSGDMSGDKTSVVGYLSAVIYHQYPLGKRYTP